MGWTADHDGHYSQRAGLMSGGEQQGRFASAAQPSDHDASAATVPELMQKSIQGLPLQVAPKEASGR